MIDNEKRIEAIAQAIAEGVEGRPLNATWRFSLLTIAKNAIAAADAVTAESHWIAPIEPTEEMTHAYGDPYVETVINSRECERIWDAMRDAYLSSPVESQDRKAS